MIIDFRVRPPSRSFPHIDIYPAPGQTKSPNWGWYCELPESVRERSMDKLLAEMAGCGVDYGVVWGRADMDPANSTPHADVAAIVQQYAGTMIAGFGGISLRDGLKRALDEVESAVVGHGLKGVTVEPGWSGLPMMYADDPRLYPIYDLCQDLDVIMAMTISVRMGSDLSYSNPEAVDRVAGDFPKLKIVVSHAFWPWVEASCGLAFRRPNVYLLPDLYGWSCPGHHKWVEAANTYLQDRMLFGSAYPLMGTRDIVQAYQRLPYRDGVLEKVMYGNAARLLGMEG
jgi:predicted TIM-barrel fold metal-dependent hydrolase